MKMLEVQLAELKEVIIAADVKAGFTEAAAMTAWKDAMSGDKSVEQQLSIATERAKKLGITESGRPARVQRKNGSAINESTKDEGRVQLYLKKGFTVRESYIMCGLPDPGPAAKTPVAFTESLFKAWKDYCGGFISDADARTLANRGISPE
jgi:hypothetical protein